MGVKPMEDKIVRQIPLTTHYLYKYYTVMYGFMMYNYTVMYVIKYSPYNNTCIYCTCTGTSCSQRWSSRGVTAGGPIDRRNTDTVHDCGIEAGYLSTVSTATTD